MKKLTVCFTLTLLFALSISASSLTLYLGGKATIKYSNLPETFFYVSITGAKDSFSTKKAVAIKDTLDGPSNTLDIDIFSGFPTKKAYARFVNASCSLSVIAKKKGFIFGTCDSFFWSSLPTGGWSAIGTDFIIACAVYEKKPKIMTSLNYLKTGSLNWGVDSSTIIDSQFISISHKNSNLNSLISLSTIQRSYPMVASTITGDTITVEIITMNADSSDTSKCIIPPISTSIKNKMITNLALQKISSAVFDIQGRLIYKGFIDSKFIKFSAGKYIASNKTRLILY